MSINRIQPGKRLSAAVVHGDTIYIAGQIASDAATDVKGQTQQILKKFDELLAAAGSNKSKLLSATIWLADMRYFDDMNSVWDSWMDPANPPARATVEARLAAPKYFVEIPGIAAWRVRARWMTPGLVPISGPGSRSRTPAASGPSWPGFPPLALCVVTGDQFRHRADGPVWHAPADGGASATAIRKTLSAACKRGSAETALPRKRNLRGHCGNGDPGSAPCLRP